MVVRVDKYVRHHWKNPDEIICGKIENRSDILKIDCNKIKVLIVRYHIPSQSIYVLINHSVVGGGDYLILGSVMFDGKTNSLINEPTNSIKDKFVCSMTKIHFQYAVLRHLFFKKPRLRNKIII